MIGGENLFLVLHDGQLALGGNLVNLARRADRSAVDLGDNVALNDFLSGERAVGRRILIDTDTAGGGGFVASGGIVNNRAVIITIRYGIVIDGNVDDWLLVNDRGIIRCVTAKEETFGKLGRIVVLVAQLIRNFFRRLNGGRFARIIVGSVFFFSSKTGGCKRKSDNKQGNGGKNLFHGYFPFE